MTDRSEPDLADYRHVATLGSWSGRAPFAALVDPGSYRTVAARWAARNFVAGGIGALLLIVVIHLRYGTPPDFRTVDLIEISVGVAVIGIVIPFLFRRSLTAGMFVAGTLTSLSVAVFSAAVGPALAPSVAQGVVIVAASAPILFPRRWAVAILVSAVATVGLVLGTEPHGGVASLRVDVLVVQVALYAVLMLGFADTLLHLAAFERRAREASEGVLTELSGVDERRRHFLHRMSHELRTPLNAIIGFSEMVQTGMAGPLAEGQTDYVADITSSGRHLLALVDDVLDVGRVEDGQLDLYPVEISVRRVVSESIAVCREQALRASVALRADIPADMGTISVDERKIKQILLNLLSNALDFTPPGGHVAVSAVEEAGGVRISVVDTGPGVARADRERIFRAFEQGATGAGARKSGTGLGLSVARDLAELHGGRLELEDRESPGAAFFVWLPRRPPAERPASRPAAAGWDRTTPTASSDPGILDDGSALERLSGARGLSRYRARITAVAGIAEAAGAGLALVLPRRAGVSLGALPWLAVALTVMAAVLMHPSARLSARVMFAMTFAIVGVTAWIMWDLGADLSSSVSSILLMEGMAAFTFFRLRPATVIGAEVAALYGLISWLQPGGDYRLLRWLLTASMIAGGALLSRWLLGFLPALVESENRARRETEVANQELRAASQHKSDFLASMSHELRTPLNAIIGFADALTQGMFGPLDPKPAEYLGEVATAGRHLLHLINDILDLAKADAGRLELARSPASVTEMLEAACGPARRAAEHTGVSFEMLRAEHLPLLDADAGRLAQAVRCVVDNAVHFTPAGGQVYVTATRWKHGVRIAVRDSGPGIAPADHERIFAAFEHAGDLARRGSGIGLALARRLVELHGGTVTVDSEPGEGSEFFIDLPEGASEPAESRLPTP